MTTSPLASLTQLEISDALSALSANQMALGVDPIEYEIIERALTDARTPWTAKLAGNQSDFDVHPNQADLFLDAKEIAAALVVTLDAARSELSGSTKGKFTRSIYTPVARALAWINDLSVPDARGKTQESLRDESISELMSVAKSLADQVSAYAITVSEEALEIANGGYVSPHALRPREQMFITAAAAQANADVISKYNALVAEGAPETAVTVLVAYDFVVDALTRRALSPYSRSMSSNRLRNTVNALERQGRLVWISEDNVTKYMLFIRALSSTILAVAEQQ